MTIQDNMLSKGDFCFVFPSFPLEFQSLNPINGPIKIIDEGIYLADTPAYNIFHNPSHKKDVKNIAKTEWIYHGFYLKSGECNMSIKVDPLIIDKEKKVWAIIGALLLIKPLYIHAGGCFVYGDADSGFIHDPQKFDLRSNISFDLSEFSIQPQSWLSYDRQDFELMKQLYPIILRVLNKDDINNKRTWYNITQFMQALIFEKIHYARTLYSKLFPLLDSLAGNPLSGKVTDISERLGKFLADIPFIHHNTNATQEIITNRLKHIWGLHRYPELHGHMKEGGIVPKGETSDTSYTLLSDKKNLKDLKDLTEIARVSLLKTLLLNDNSKEEYSQIPIPLTGKNKSEAKEPNKERNIIATSFFTKPHSNPNALFFCSDLQDSK